MFALPMRTRLAGLNPEGLGLAALEAAACGLPVIVGDSGGAPETVLDGETGFVVAVTMIISCWRTGSACCWTIRHWRRRWGRRGRRYVVARIRLGLGPGDAARALEL